MWQGTDRERAGRDRSTDGHSDLQFAAADNLPNDAGPSVGAQGVAEALVAILIQQFAWPAFTKDLDDHFADL